MVRVADGECRLKLRGFTASLYAAAPEQVIPEQHAAQERMRGKSWRRHTDIEVRG